jgi:hypothetical protein
MRRGESRLPEGKMGLESRMSSSWFLSSETATSLSPSPLAVPAEHLKVKAIGDAEDLPAISGSTAPIDTAGLIPCESPPPYDIHFAIARVAELADALDSGFNFWRFQGVSSRFTISEKTIDFIGRSTFSPSIVSGHEGASHCRNKCSNRD